MMTYFWRAVLVVSILGSEALCAQQVATGTPSFNSFGGGPFDTVNLGNLNVHFAIPILHKAGRGMAFTYDLNYDSSVWTPVSSGGITSWTPVVNWGWRGVTEVELGYVTYSTYLQYCTQENGNQVPYTLYDNYAYHDAFGVIHNFDFQTATPARLCSTGIPTYASGTADDGSGYYMNVTTGSIHYVLSRGGTTLHPPVSSTNGSGSKIDTNGNEITTDGNGNFYDTLSGSSPVLTVSGAGTPSSPMLYAYTAPGGAAKFTVSYTQYTVRTNFASGTIHEYGPLSVSLVSAIQLPDQSEYTIDYEKTPGSCTPLSGTYQNNCVTGRIGSVTLPTGGTVTYTYTGGANGINSDGSTAGLTRVLSPGGAYQYTRTLKSGTPGPASTWQTAFVDPAGNNTVINFSEDNGSTFNMYETQRQVYQGNVNSTNCSSTVPTNCLLLTTTSCYNGNYSNCSGTIPGSPITQTDQYAQPAGGSVRLSQVLYSNNLVTDDSEYNYGVSLNAAPSLSYLVRETVTTYASLSNGIINRPASVVVKDWSSGSSVTLSSTSYTYDQGTVTTTTNTPQHVSISGSRGNPTTISGYVSSTTSLSKTITYFDTGTPNVATDVNGAQTTYVYSSTGSCGNSFATTINEPLGLSRSFTWSCTGGVATQMQDENGNQVAATYSDPDFWRATSMTDQMNNQTNLTYSPTTSESALQNFNSGNSASDLLTTVDGFGRSIYTQRKQGPNLTSYDTRETDYNNLGQPYRSTMPYSAAASPSTQNTTIAATTKTYDALGRVLTTTDANGGTVSFTYTANDVLQKVSGGQTFQKQFEYDGLGRLTSVCEISGALPGVGTCGQTTAQTGYWTRYKYDAAGHLIGVCQNTAQAMSVDCLQNPSVGQQTRTFSYDLLGRMLTESNPESGTKTYTYDTSSSWCNHSGGYSSPGSLMEVVDHAGSHICWVRDGMGRPNTTYNPDASGQWHNCRNTVYGDQITQSRIPGWTATNSNSLGRLALASIDYNCNGGILPDEWFSYDKTGRVTDVWEATPNSGGYYHSTTSYWANGAVSALSLLNSSATPLFPTQTYGVDSEGRTNSVSAASGQNPVTAVTYSPGTSTAPLGALTGVTFGSADSDAFTYDPNTGRMKSYTFTVNSKTDAGTLSWNANGTLTQLVINDQIPGTTDSQNCTYGYDDVKRLSNVTCSTTLWVQNFTYDAFGNIQKSVPAGDGGQSFLPTYWTSPANNQFESLPGATPVYDNVGNLLTDNLNSYTWDGYGQMVTVTPSGGSAVTATYDALGRMVEANSGGAYAQFVYGPTGKVAKCNGQNLVRALIPLPGGAKAVYNSTGLAYYRHSDWLGSSRLTSTASRTMYSSSAYAPFGEQYATSGTADASYTGQDQDTVSSLYDFPARRLSSSQGRWISPDPAGKTAVTLTNPQSWNRYAYVNNNPLSLYDSTGMQCENEYDDDESDCVGDPGDGGNGAGDCSDGSCDGNGDNSGDNSGDNGDDNSGCALDDTQCQQQEANQALQSAALALLTNTDCAALIGGPSAAGQAVAIGAVAGQLFGNPNQTISFSAAPEEIDGFAETDLTLVPTPTISMSLSTNFYSPGYAAQNGVSSLTFAQNQTVTILHEYVHAMGYEFGLEIDSPGLYGTGWTTNIKSPDNAVTDPGISNLNDQSVASDCLQGGNVPTQTSQVDGTIQ